MSYLWLSGVGLGGTRLGLVQKTGKAAPGLQSGQLKHTGGRGFGSCPHDGGSPRNRNLEGVGQQSAYRGSKEGVLGVHSKRLVSAQILYFWG